MKYFILFIMLISTAQANEFKSALKSAMIGDYQAQRNIAYLLKQGAEGAPLNPIEGCAWNFIIIATQGAKVGDNDVLIDQSCGEQRLKKSALARAESLLKQVPTPVRTVEGDIAILTDDSCPGSNCNGSLKAFADAYLAAVKGEIGAQRKIIECFVKGCGTQPSLIDFFRACLWSGQLMSALGGKATREDKAMEFQSCGSLGPLGQSAISPHIGMIDAMRSLR